MSDALRRNSAGSGTVAGRDSAAMRFIHTEIAAASRHDTHEIA